MKKAISVTISLAAASALIVGAAACGGSSGGSDSDFVKRDRMGMPAINTALIPSGMKDDFNAGDPADDPENFRETMLASIRGLRSAVSAVPGFPAEDSPGLAPEDVVGVVNPDVLTIDLSSPTVWPNGRGLTDEVIDGTLGVVLNRGDVLGGGPGVSDGVGNDSPTIAQFPYAGPPQAQ